MNERMMMINEYLSGEYTISEMACQRGVSRKTVYKWIERYERDGPKGLEELSRAPHYHHNAISESMEQRILELKAERPLWGAPKIHAKLRDDPECPSESTVSNILSRHGLSRKVRRRSKATPSQQPLSHCQAVNQVWCADFKGWFRTGDGHRCDPLTVSDAHSRYLLCCQSIATSTNGVTVKPVFIRTYREYGLPDVMRIDNGPPFASVGLGGLTELSVWWIRLGIHVERIEPGKPQQNGRHERMHRTLKEATAKPPRSTLGAQQKAFDVFRYEYNYERPHEALGQNSPASLYVASSREYPERLPPQRGYPEDWQERKVSPGGQMVWRGSKIFISHALVDQIIGFKPIDDALWAVYFENVELGRFDERRKRVFRMKKP